MSNLMTLTQDEIDRWELKGKQPGDTITAEEYSKHSKEYQEKQNKQEVKTTDSPVAKAKK